MKLHCPNTERLLIWCSFALGFGLGCVFAGILEVLR
jgi:hypothetical protein